MWCMFANATFAGGRATAARPRGRSASLENQSQVACSSAVSDGTCEAACACRITRMRHSSVNSEVVSGTGSGLLFLKLLRMSEKEEEVS